MSCWILSGTLWPSKSFCPHSPVTVGGAAGGSHASLTSIQSPSHSPLPPAAGALLGTGGGGAGLGAAWAAGTFSPLPHFGHLTDLPACSALTLNLKVQTQV